MTDPEKSRISQKANMKDVQENVRLASEIFENYGDAIRAMIHFNTKDKTKTDDIFQSFFMSIVHKPIPTDIDDIKAYLYRAVTNDVIDLSRENKCRKEHTKKYAECQKPFIKTEDPQKTVMRIEDTKKMFQLIESRLPKRQAEVVIQRYGQGFNTTDTAKKMQVDKRIVSRYLTVALRKMREFVPEHPDEPI